MAGHRRNTVKALDVTEGNYFQPVPASTYTPTDTGSQAPNTVTSSQSGNNSGSSQASVPAPSVSYEWVVKDT